MVKNPTELNGKSRFDHVVYNVHGKIGRVIIADVDSEYSFGNLARAVKMGINPQ
jgi:hypothetical protein